MDISPSYDEVAITLPNLGCDQDNENKGESRL